jgi:hypothetical protein
MFFSKIIFGDIGAWRLAGGPEIYGPATRCNICVFEEVSSFRKWQSYFEYFREFQ